MLISINITYSFLRTYYIGKECPLGTEPSLLKRSCVEVVCNGEALIEKTSGGGGRVNQGRLYFLNTFIYDSSISKCVSKCKDLDKEYYQNYVRYTEHLTNIYINRDYYYWKNEQCVLLPQFRNTFSRDIALRRQREDQVRALENKELAKKITQEENTLKEYFLRILEENKDYYKNAYYNH